MPLYRNLLADTVFVFDSNLAGQHADDSAAFAVQYCSAELGVAEGPTGKSYAVPTKDEHRVHLPLTDVQWYIEQLLAYARTQRDLRFQVGRLGCNSGGLLDIQMAPLFKKTSDNLFVPGRWMALTNQLDRIRLFVDGDSTTKAERIEKTLTECTSPWSENVEVVTTGTGSVNDIVRAWARRKGLPWTPFLPDNARYNSEAARILDEQIAWYCTHAIGYHAQNDPALSRRMVHLQKEGLRVREFRE